MDQITGVAVLLHFPIHFTAYRQGIGICHYLLQYNRRTKRARTIHTFPKKPLSTISFLLPITSCYVLCHCETKHMIHCIRWANITCTFSDNDSQLHFPVKLLQKESKFQFYKFNAHCLTSSVSVCPST